MKLLLCLPHKNDFEILRQHVLQSCNQTWAIDDNQDVNYITSIRYLQHDLDIAFLGNTQFETSHKLTKLLTTRYHLALYAGFAAAVKEDIEVGSVVNVIKEKPICFTTDDEDIYESNEIKAGDYPHFKGAFINMNNSYMNIFLDLRKVVDGTYTGLHGESAFKSLADKNKLDIVSQNGISFVYNCMFERQAFYQIRAIESNLMTQEKDKEKAIQNLNHTLIEILKNI